MTDRRARIEGLVREFKGTVDGIDLPVEIYGFLVPNGAALFGLRRAEKAG